MTSPVKNQSQFNVAQSEPEVSFTGEIANVPLAEIKRSTAQACKQFSASVFPCSPHVTPPLPSPSSVDSVNQQRIEKVMETFTPEKGNKERMRAFRERSQENLSLYLRRRATKKRGYIGWLADTLACSESKASKLTYGEANPHWTDPIVFALEQDGLVPYLREVFGEEYVDAALRKEALRILSELLERANT